MSDPPRSVMTMRVYVTLVIILICLCLRTYGSSLPNASAGLTSLGEHFVLAFTGLQSNRLYLAAHYLLVSSKPVRDYLSDTNVTIEYNNTSLNASLTSSLPMAVFEIPTSLVLTGNGSDEGQAAITVTSSSPISLTAVGGVSWYAQDTFLVLPSTSLGSIYVVVTFAPFQGSSAFVKVTSMETNTRVAFIEGDHVIRVTLDAAESYQRIAERELTGVLVKASGPVSVTSGVYLHKRDDLSPIDMVTLTLTPVCTWGAHHVTFPTPGVDSNLTDAYRLVASRANTSVSVTTTNATTNFILESPGDWRELNVSADSLLVIESSLPLMVAKLMESEFLSPRRVDPCGSLVVPTEQWLKSYRVTVPANSTTTLIAVMRKSRHPVTTDSLNETLTWRRTDVISDSHGRRFHVNMLPVPSSSLTNAVTLTSFRPFALYVMRWKSKITFFSQAGMGLRSLCQGSSEETLTSSLADASLFTSAAVDSSRGDSAVDSPNQIPTNDSGDLTPVNQMGAMTSHQDAVVMTEASVDISPTSLADDAVPLSGSACLCRRHSRCYVSTAATIEMAVVHSQAQRRARELQVDRKALSSSKRKLYSVADFRPSAQAVGSVLGIGVVSSVLVVLVVPDLIAFVTHVWRSLSERRDPREGRREQNQELNGHVTPEEAETAPGEGEEGGKASKAVTVSDVTAV